MGSKCYLMQPSGNESRYFSRKAVPVARPTFAEASVGNKGMAQVLPSNLLILLSVLGGRGNYFVLVRACL